MVSKNSSKTIAANKEGMYLGDSISQENLSTILAAIGAQGDDLKKLLEDKMTSLSARLDALDTSLANLQSEQAGVKQKMAEIEGAVNAVDLHLVELEKVSVGNKSLWAEVNDLVDVLTG